MSRRGLTLIELLVASAIVATLVALLLPAVQYAREAARRSHCRSNLHQIGIAAHAYHSSYAMFPPGASNGFSLHTAILPHIDQSAIASALNFSLTPDDPPNMAVARIRIAVYTCPSDPIADVPDSGGARCFGASYAGNFGTGVVWNGYNGLFQHLSTSFPKYPEGPVTAASVIDGLSNTVMMSELLVGDGTRTLLRANWNTPVEYSGPGDQDVFADACQFLNTAPASADGWSRGRTWIAGDASLTLYNHVITPNQLSCYNRTRVQSGAFTAASLHGSMVHALFGDGRVQPVSSGIDRSIWRAMGSRNSGDVF